MPLLGGKTKILMLTFPSLNGCQIIDAKVYGIVSPEKSFAFKVINCG